MQGNGFALAMESSLPALDMTTYCTNTVSLCGYFTETYEPIPELVAARKMVADGAAGFDGTRSVREFTFG